MAAKGAEDFMSDEIVTNKCCICAKQNKIIEAAHYCDNCKDYFCAPCVGIHTMVPSTEGHRMLDKSHFKSVSSGAEYLPSFPTQRCDQHKAEVLNMYCQDHDKVGCTTCIAVDHRSCKRIFSIPENIDNLYKSSDISIVEQKISSLGKEIEAFRKAKEAHAQALSKSLQTAVDSVKTFKQELQLLLNKIEEETISELRKEFNLIEKSVEDEVNNAVNLINKLQKMTAQLKNTAGNKVQEFVCVKTCAALNKKYEDDLNQQQRQSDETFSFTADQSIKQFLQQINSFGKITCQKVNVKVPDDTNDCNIWGSCITEDDCLLLADYGNKKLKCMNLSSGRVTDFISLISPPNAVCQVSKTDAAVSLDNKTVQFMTLGDKLTATRNLLFTHNCEGLAHHNAKLFISDGGKSVYIHDINGNELQKLTTVDTGNDIFSRASHVAISADGSRVLVADWNKGMITLDIQGNYLSTLSNSEMQASGCTGVCTDGSNVFVCGRWSDNVVQIGQDHKLIGHIATVSSPLSVCFDSQKRRLYVTTNSSNDVIVLELV